MSNPLIARWLAKTPAPYPNYTTPELLEELEIVRWMLLDARNPRPDEERPLAPATAAYLQHQLQGVVSELEKRERLRALPGTPAWPNWFRDRRQEVEDIKASLSTVDVLRSVFRAEPKPRGQRWVCRCPLPGHDDQTASFVVYPDQSWFCFGCQQGGDVLHLLKVGLQADTFGQVVDAARELAGIAA